MGCAVAWARASTEKLGVWRGRSAWAWPKASEFNEDSAAAAFESTSGSPHASTASMWVWLTCFDLLSEALKSQTDKQRNADGVVCRHSACACLAPL
eukprot:scaffold108635_cov60-Phaeocystis_antarctica.AAC.2